MSSEDREEVYILEKTDITPDEDDDYNYEEIKDSELDDDESLQKLGDSSEEDDLSDFEKLKAKTTQKKLERESMGGATGSQMGKTKHRQEIKPRVVKKDVVIDDYIRNYLSKFNMHKTLNIFQQEWNELAKKNVFNDNHLGKITDTENKNARMTDRIEKMKEELKQEKVKADKAKSTWEKLRKERDFHKTHQQRVQKEKGQISENIKKLLELQEQYDDKIKELTKKYEMTLKEKTLLKLDKEKLQKRAQNIKAKIKEREDEVAQAIEQSKARNAGKKKPKQIMKMKGRNTPYPKDDARPNPFLAQEYDEFSSKLSNQKIVKAHDKAIGGM